MHELDQAWGEMLAEAAEKARLSGRGDVADYLTLKASNDAIRQAGVRWLFDTAIGLTAEANRRGASVAMEREDPHNFRFHNANMAGSLLRLRYGVRCLTIEAGWTRTPKDGFMRGGALAVARITHFGMPKAGAELALYRPADVPVWNVLINEKIGRAVHLDDMLQHFRIFLG